MQDRRQLTIGRLLDNAAKANPNGEAVVDLVTGGRITWGGLAGQSDNLARGLLELGLEPGGRLALWAPNQPEWIIWQMAAAKAGLVLTNVDNSFGADQLEYLLSNSKCRVLAMARGMDGDEYLEAAAQLCPELKKQAGGVLQCERLPDLQRVVIIGSSQGAPGALSMDQVMDLGGKADPAGLASVMQRQRADDLACLFYTSGTTGAPKGAMLTHYGLINTSLQSAVNQGLGKTSRLCLSVPLSHAFGCACVGLAALTVGAAMVIPARRPDAKSALDAVEAEGCTAVYGAPTTFIDMLALNKEKPRDLSRLATGIMAGAQCPMELMQRVVDELGVGGILVGYGQTESSTWICQSRPDDPLELRVSTVGRPLKGVEVKIIDPASGEELQNGEVGELCARGYNMKGYFGMPAATATALDPKGWLHTGDLASRDEHGYVRIAGRLKEVIRTGGRVIFPGEVEEAFFQHPAVKNIQVFGVAHPQLGEQPAAWVKLEPNSAASPEELLAWCKEKLGAEKTPAHIKVVDSFPMTSLGKIQKFQMSRIYAEELGLSEA